MKASENEHGRVGVLWADLEEVLRTRTNTPYVSGDGTKPPDIREVIDKLEDQQLKDTAHRLRRDRNNLAHRGKSIPSLDQWEKDCKAIIDGVSGDAKSILLYKWAVLMIVLFFLYFYYLTHHIPG